VSMYAQIAQIYCNRSPSLSLEGKVKQEEQFLPPKEKSAIGFLYSTTPMRTTFGPIYDTSLGYISRCPSIVMRENFLYYTVLM